MTLKRVTYNDFTAWKADVRADWELIHNNIVRCAVRISKSTSHSDRIDVIASVVIRDDLLEVRMNAGYYRHSETSEEIQAKIAVGHAVCNRLASWCADLNPEIKMRGGVVELE